MNHFFKILNVSNQDDSYHIDVCINPTHDVFKGHFPGTPVVPGVFMLELIKRTVSEIKQIDLRYSAITDCKFVSLIVPENDSNMQLQMKVTPDAGHPSRYKVKCSVISEGIVKLKLNSTLTPQ